MANKPQGRDEDVLVLGSADLPHYFLFIERINPPTQAACISFLSKSSISFSSSQSRAISKAPRLKVHSQMSFSGNQPLYRLVVYHFT
jgi:hypothetical protein